MEDKSNDQLIDLSVSEFINETASELPAPGGGSVSALVGALGAALGSMVANLSSHKKDWDDRWEEFSDWAEKGKYFHQELLRCVDEDTRAFNLLMEAFSLPKTSEKEKEERKLRIGEATRTAMNVPFRVMQLACDSMEVLRAMAETGNPNSVSDAGVGALCALTAVEGAYLNVKINASGFDDKEYLASILNQSGKISQSAKVKAEEILEIVNSKILSR
jgi:glutamate formiminotransferase/formiminotetrahydrofolate cyclodeaminase